ncbi:hypothetical protein I305_05081 [Cryptococcus gattii E566]|nr:hypothetical protein I305_05081 [Cryptococcus gattii E566]
MTAGYALRVRHIPAKSSSKERIRSAVAQKTPLMISAPPVGHRDSKHGEASGHDLAQQCCSSEHLSYGLPCPKIEREQRQEQLQSLQLDPVSRVTRSYFG